jgi:hypothetical protein
MLVLIEIGGANRTVKVHSDVLMIGRDTGNDLVIDDASPFHARISEKDGRYLLEDLNTADGTFFNQARIGSQWVVPDGVLQIGKSRWKCLLHEIPHPENPIEPRHQTGPARKGFQDALEETPRRHRTMGETERAKRPPRLLYDSQPAWTYSLLYSLVCLGIVVLLEGYRFTIQLAIVSITLDNLGLSDVAFLRNLQYPPIIALIFIGLSIRQLLWNYTTRYHITEVEITSHTGIFTRHQRNDRLDKFHDIGYRQGLIGRLDGSGTIILRSQLGDYLELRGIRNLHRIIDEMRPFLSPPTASIRGQILPGNQYNAVFRKHRGDRGCGCLIFVIAALLLPVLGPVLVNSPLFQFLGDLLSRFY